MPQKHSPTRPPSRKQAVLAVILLLLSAVFCTVVSGWLKQPERGLQILLLSIGAGVAAVCVIWLMRYSWHVSRQAQASVKPQRITPRYALLRMLGFGTATTVMWLCIGMTVFQGGASHLLNALYPLLASLFYFLPCTIYNFRLFQKAKRDGVLIITPAHLPPDEKTNLKSKGILSNIDYAVPEAELIRINHQDKTTSTNAWNSLDAPHKTLAASEPPTQQLTLTNL